VSAQLATPTTAIPIHLPSDTTQASSAEMTAQPHLVLIDPETLLPSPFGDTGFTMTPQVRGMTYWYRLSL
jgi:hypothetical protein